MFPFISGRADLRAALDLLAEVRDALRRESVALGPDLQVGVNLEVPSAALTADLLAADVDFFSIGTNDLVQYLLAADRVDPRVSAHYQPLHPAVLRVLRQVVQAAGQHGVPIAVCGEMAADPLQALVLVGLGVRELSLTPVAIPRVKHAVRSVNEPQAREAALGCLSLATAEEVEQALGHQLVDALTPDEDGPRPFAAVEE